MNRGYDLRTIQGMPPGAEPALIERIVETGFSSLTSLVVAEATGNAPLAAREVLGKRHNCDAWVLALMHVRANLSLSLAVRRVTLRTQDAEDRPPFADDQQIHKLERTRSRVVTRLAEARNRARSLREAAAKASEAAAPPTPRSSPGVNSLVRAHPIEFEEEVVAALHQSGLSQEIIAPPRGAENDPRWGVQARVIRRPMSGETRELLMASDTDFAEMAGEDVRTEGGLYSGLRHPLLLDRWGDALDDLIAMTLPRVELAAGDCRDGVPESAWRDLPADPEAARKWAGRLRFLDAVFTRRFERETLMEDVSLEIRHGIRRHQMNLEARACEALCRRFPKQLALYAALTT